MYKRKNSYLIYTVVATATIFGFSIEFPSSFVFLLPLIVVIPLGYRNATLNRSILHVGTFIATVIEPKMKGLHWETYQQWRRENADKNKKIHRGIAGYMLFDLIGIFCVLMSIGYAVITDKLFNQNILDFHWQLNEPLVRIVVLLCFWTVSLSYLLWVTLKIRDSYGLVTQNKYKKQIFDFLKASKKIDK